ncbi:predicted protein [Plenodomus lingam JN3]|uniref:Uncharacterized protein n=1 Tax=Leptosphaeria maculans (strain JN3 / isolate v23.1.3 / race Av1-4-5-6-7-8) TaxID=985895 RepID=E4ZFZ3_LEPMJ|nr:predicted protein [Plenodomus lingam JN3]CBX90213.1 predicted protein [Plenodomus lingam JN3]
MWMMLATIALSRNRRTDTHPGKPVDRCAPTLHTNARPSVVAVPSLQIFLAVIALHSFRYYEL